MGQLKQKKIKIDHTDPLQYLASTPINSFYLAPVTQAQVFTLFSWLKESKASFNIPNKLIKLASGPLAVPFTKIYNLIITIRASF